MIVVHALVACDSLVIDVVMPSVEGAKRVVGLVDVDDEDAATLTTDVRKRRFLLLPFLPLFKPLSYQLTQALLISLPLLRTVLDLEDKHF